jgi:hypothetical protein
LKKLHKISFSIFIPCNNIHFAGKIKYGAVRPAISQSGLDLWLEQASDFFAGRQRCV